MKDYLRTILWIGLTEVLMKAGGKMGEWIDKWVIINYITEG
jgi:hypothetical protein